MYEALCVNSVPLSNVQTQIISSTCCAECLPKGGLLMQTFMVSLAYCLVSIPNMLDRVVSLIPLLPRTYS